MIEASSGAVRSEPAGCGVIVAFVACVGVLGRFIVWCVWCVWLSDENDMRSNSSHLHSLPQCSNGAKLIQTMTKRRCPVEQLAMGTHGGSAATPCVD